MTVYSKCPHRILNPRTEKRLIAATKNNLEIISDDKDVNDSIRLKTLAAANYLMNGGASEESVMSPAGMTCVAIGVNDLMNRKAGEAKFSPAFYMLANQVTRG